MKIFLLITDGDVDRTEGEKKAKVNAKYAGNEPGKEERVINILKHIKQFSIPDYTKPEEYYIKQVLNCCDDDVAVKNEEFLFELRNCPTRQNPHEYLSFPISQVYQDPDSKVGYNAFAEMLSSTPAWDSIVAPIESWLKDRMNANNNGEISTSLRT